MPQCLMGIFGLFFSKVLTPPQVLWALSRKREWHSVIDHERNEELFTPQTLQSQSRYRIVQMYSGSTSL